MKTILNKLEQSVKNTYKQTMQQTQKTVDQTKYRTELITLKNTLNKHYQMLGRLYYKQVTNQQDDSNLETLCHKITELNLQIKTTQQKIDELVNSQKNSFDDFKKEVKDTWQDETSEKTYERDEKGIKILKFCPQCQIGNARDASYCSHCGHPFR